MHNHQCVTKGSNQKKYNAVRHEDEWNVENKKEKKSEILCDYSANERKGLYYIKWWQLHTDWTWSLLVFMKFINELKKKKNKLKEFPKQFNIQRATQSHDSRANVIVSISILMITCLLSKATWIKWLQRLLKVSHSRINVSIWWISFRLNQMKKKRSRNSFVLDGSPMRFVSHFRMKWKVNASKISSS